MNDTDMSDSATQQYTRRSVLGGIASASLIGIAGCGGVRGQNMNCEGDCDLVADWSTDTQGGSAFEKAQTTVSVKFKEDFTGTVAVEFYTLNTNEFKAGNEKEINDQRYVEFLFESYQSEKALLIVEAAGGAA